MRRGTKKYATYRDVSTNRSGTKWRFSWEGGGERGIYICRLTFFSIYFFLEADRTPGSHVGKQGSAARMRDGDCDASQSKWGRARPDGAYHGAEERTNYTALTSPLSCIMTFSDPMIMVRWHKATAE